MVDAAISAASVIETSHIEVQLFQHDCYIVYYCFLMFIHACLTISAFGNCSPLVEAMISSSSLVVDVTKLDIQHGKLDTQETHFPILNSNFSMRCSYITKCFNIFTWTCS